MGNAKRIGKYSVHTDKYTETGLTHRQAMILGQHNRNRNQNVVVFKQDEHGKDTPIWSYITPTPFENV